jgi:hypothetical protein
MAKEKVPTIERIQTSPKALQAIQTSPLIGSKACFPREKVSRF